MYAYIYIYMYRYMYRGTSSLLKYKCICIQTHLRPLRTMDRNHMVWRANSCCHYCHVLGCAGGITLINDITPAYSASNFVNLRYRKSRLDVTSFAFFASRSILDMSRNWREYSCEKGQLMRWWAANDAIILRHLVITKHMKAVLCESIDSFNRSDHVCTSIHSQGIVW